MSTKAHHHGNPPTAQGSEAPRAFDLSSIVNPVVGTQNGPRIYLYKSSQVNVTGLQLWLGDVLPDYRGIVGIRVTFEDDSDLSAGYTHDSPTATLDLTQGDSFKSFNIHAGARIDKFTIDTKFEKHFEQGGSGGTSNVQDVGDGYLEGFEVTVKDGVISSLASRFEIKPER